MNKIQDILYSIHCYLQYTEPYHTINDTYHNVRNYLFHRYDLIPTGLKKTQWYDKDTVMLYGMMNLLVDYVEKEECFTTIDWSDNECSKKSAKEIKEIYDWWKNYPVRENQIDSQRSIWHDEFIKRDGEGIEKFNNSSKSDTEKDESEKLHKMEADLLQEEEEMLIRLVKIRPCLWT